MPVQPNIPLKHQIKRPSVYAASAISPPTPPASQPDIRSRVNITLPASVHEGYEEEARNSSLDSVFSARLSRCSGHVADKPLYFDDLLRQEVEGILGANLASAEEAVTLLRGAMSVRVNDIQVLLSPDTLLRLKSRCQDPNFPRWVQALVKRLLTLYTEGQLG